MRYIVTIIRNLEAKIYIQCRKKTPYDEKEIILYLEFLEENFFLKSNNTFDRKEVMKIVCLEINDNYIDIE